MKTCIVIVQTDEEKSAFHYYGAKNLVGVYGQALKALEKDNTVICHHNNLATLLNALQRACQTKEFDTQHSNLRKLLGHQYVPYGDDRRALLQIRNFSNGDDCLLAINVFNYGMICGKRAERKRRATCHD